MLTIQFSTRNAGLRDGDDGPTSPYAVADLLRKVADQVEDYQAEGVVRDINGHVVGSWVVTDPEDEIEAAPLKPWNLSKHGAVPTR